MQIKTLKDNYCVLLEFSEGLGCIPSDIGTLLVVLKAWDKNVILLKGFCPEIDLITHRLKREGYSVYREV